MGWGLKGYNNRNQRVLSKGRVPAAITRTCTGTRFEADRWATLWKFATVALQTTHAAWQRLDTGMVQKPTKNQERVPRPTAP